MIISITGGTGFIGKLLVERHLAMGDHVKILSRNSKIVNSNVQTFIGDLSSHDVDLSGFIANTDILYHCAGEIENESLMKELHVNGTKRLVDSAQGKVGRLVQLSSVGAYGKFRDGIINEDLAENPLGLYETTKNESDNIIKNSGIPYVILRPSSVFGNSMTNKSLFKLITMIRKGLFFYIGKKHVKVNYIHVDEVIEALLKCGTKANALGNIYIISQSTTVQKMVESFLMGLNIQKFFFRVPESIIRAIVGVFSRIPGIPLTLSRVDALTGNSVYDSRKIMNELDFKFSKSLEERLTLFAKQK
jgi:nucleoside-diphosphate-sugar epimerase